MKQHDDILKRARLLAQAANEAADAALLSQQNDHNTKKALPQSPALVPVPQMALPLVKKEKSSSKAKSSEKVKSLEKSTAVHSEASTSLPPIILKGETVIADNRQVLPPQIDPIIQADPLPSRDPLTSERLDDKMSASADRLPSLPPKGDVSPRRVPSTNLEPHPPIDESATTLPPREREVISDPISQYIEQYLQSRASVVVQRHAPQQVLCHLCCAEFGTASLLIHQKTCWSKQYVDFAVVC
jgi:hypothetical protein